MQAAAVAKKILGFYPEIPASDPETFAAGLVTILSHYPSEVQWRAADPVFGVPGKLRFLNLAAIRDLLDKLGEEYAIQCRREEMERIAKLPPPPEPDEAMKARIREQFRQLSEHLKSGFSPSTQP